MIYSLGVLEEQDIVTKSLRHPPFANADTQYNNYVTSILAIARDCFGWHPGS